MLHTFLFLCSRSTCTVTKTQPLASNVIDIQFYFYNDEKMELRSTPQKKKLMAQEQRRRRTPTQQQPYNIDDGKEGRNNPTQPHSGRERRKVREERVGGIKSEQSNQGMY